MGQKRLDKAIAQFSSSNSAPVEVEWKPFQIDPGTAQQGERFEDYCERRWGGSGWTNHLRREGSKDGATFSNWKWWPNTLKAHQLILFAQKHGVDTNSSNACIFKAMYEEGKNVALTDELVALGKLDLGLPEDELREYLENNEGASEVSRDIQAGKRKYNISGVPFFVIGRSGDNAGRPYGLSGAQPSKTLKGIFIELANEIESEHE